jgi:putative oxidoreductase
MATLPLHTSVNATSSSNVLPLIGRIGIASIFILSGISKIAAPAATIGYIESVGLPLPQLSLGLAILIELVGGVALVAG